MNYGLAVGGLGEGQEVLERLTRELTQLPAPNHERILYFLELNLICFLRPDTELSTEGGLQIVGWLEGPTGIMWSQRTCDNPKNLGFAVSLGSTYELVSAVYGRGRMLARLSNFTFQCPQDTKKQMKKYGANVPLSAFISQSLFQKFSTDNGTTKE